MAKGDDKRVRGAIDEENAGMKQNDYNFRSGIMDPQYHYFNNQMKQANQMDAADYSRLSGGFDQFAQTGGFSPEDLSNIRARSVAPTRAVYDSAMRGVNRQRSLQGGQGQGYNTLMARMAREKGQQLDDAAINTEAGIAQMIQQGKQFGLSGGSNLYGMTPGRSNMFGNQTLQSTNQYLDMNRLDVQRALGVLGQRNAAAGIKGPWQQGFDNVMKVGETAAGVIGAF